MTRLKALASAARDVAKEIAAAVLVLMIARAVGGLAAVVLAVPVLAAVFAVSRWRWPYRGCSACKGSGRNAGSSSKRHGDCKRCRGTRRVQRPGARAVHRAILTMRGKKEK